ncbi:MAG: hypothetical protein AAB407_03535 [Patescibacteria group bacterium]
MAVGDIFTSIFDVIKATWWIILPVALGFALADIWLQYIRIKFLLGIKWKLLEIHIPRSIEKTPKAMEQIFAALRSTYSFGIKFKDKYVKGKSEIWFSCEMVGYAGGVQFFIRTPEDHRNLVESSIYAQYPDAEISEADDYVSRLGLTIPNDIYDLFGMELILARESPYPIRTYPEFEEKTEEALIDPIAAITEVMSRLKDDEMIMIQILIRPTGDDWTKEAKEIINKMIGRGSKPASKSSPVANFIGDLAAAPFKVPAPREEKKEEKKEGKVSELTPGEKDIVAAIEHKISKVGFETLVRFAYVDSRDSFSRSNISAIVGAFHQFNTQNLNSFRPDTNTMTSVKKGFFQDRKTYLRKRRMFDRYRLRLIPPKASVLNTEELATIYHFPSIAVEAPLIRYTETKKGEPPQSLPIE